MLEKLVHKFAGVIAFVLLFGGVVFFVGGPLLTRNIDEHKAYNGVAKSIKQIHSLAEEHKTLRGEWPKSYQGFERVQYLENDNWLFSFNPVGDTFIVKATISSKSTMLKKKFFGEFITVDNFGNKTYCHDELRDKYMRAYLTDAKKVERK